MEPRWITAFIDMPSASFVAGSDFWASVTGSRVGPRRGDDDEFATLVPTSGDPFCRVQATADGSAGVHIDFHVESVGGARAEAESLGATTLAALGHVLMVSPAGLRFCLVEDRDGHRVPPPVGEPPCALDQICLDIPSSLFDDELAFWRRLLAWDDRPMSRDEFHRLHEPDGLPIELLFQRLATDSSATVASAHLDLAAGDERETIAAQHVALGAARVATFEWWIVMRDPAGLEYCVTGRSPKDRSA